MANITIDVIGNTNGSGQPPQQPTNQPYAPQGQTGGTNVPPSSNIPTLTDADNQRLVADIRREMQQRGVMFVPGSNNVNQIVGQYTQQYQQQGTQQIHSKYEGIRESERREYLSKKQQLESEYDKKIESETAWWRKNDLAKERDRSVEDLGSDYVDRLEELNKQEKEETDQYNEDIVARMQQIIEILKQDSVSNPDNPNSYIGQLRQQQRELIQERDSAATREEAIDASKRLATVNEKLREATGAGGDNRFFRDPALQTAEGIQGLFGNLEGGNLGGAISSLGTIGVGLSGASWKVASKALGWIALAAGAIDAFKGASERYENVASLASYRGTSGGQRGRAAAMDINAYLAEDRNIAYFGGNTMTGVGFTDLGYNREDFMQEAASRIRARGVSEGWYDQTIRQIALEATLALNQGALREGSRFDRYGINVTDAVTKMVYSLSGIEGSGVSPKDFTRVQEKYDIEQAIMKSYLRRTDRPNYDVATSMLAAFSAVPGITQDARMGEDIATFQNALQNPMNDKMRALIFNTVQNIPGLEYTRGRPDLIERAIVDPNNEGMIMQAVIENIKQMYGGTETMMGYYAFKNIFPNISPDRLDEYIASFSDNESLASRLLRGGVDNTFVTSDGRPINTTIPELQDSYVREAKDYHTTMTKTTKEIKNSLQSLVDDLFGGKYVFGGSNGVRSAAE